MYNTTFSRFLSAFNLTKIFSDHEDLILKSKLKDIGIFEFAELLGAANPPEKKFIVKLIEMTDKKYQVMHHLGYGSEYIGLFDFSKKEIKDLNDSQYHGLLQNNFKKFADIDRIKSLSKKYKHSIFSSHPKWWVTNKLEIPEALSSDNLRRLSMTPQIVDENISDFSKIATECMFWRNMIKYNRKYEDIFLQNTNSLISKTEVRKVFYYYPELIKKIDEKVIENSKLNVKDWILLINTVRKEKKNEIIFKNWDMSPNLKEIFKLDLLSATLSGETKVTNRLSSAMKKVIDNKIDEEIEDKEDLSVEDTIDDYYNMSEKDMEDIKG